MIHPLFSMEIRFENDGVSVRQRARQISALLGFDDREQARLATAVPEIARNALHYAGGGAVAFEVDDRQGEGGIPVCGIRVSDQGPGIRDVMAVLEGRSKPPREAEPGILSARRLSDEFHIDWAPFRGTEVDLGRRFPVGILSKEPAARQQAIANIRDAPISAKSEGQSKRSVEATHAE